MYRTAMYSLVTTLFIFSVMIVSDVFAEAKFDVDQDGLSEILLLNIDSEGNVDWQLLSSASGYSVSLSDSSNFGENGLAVAVADWNGDGNIQFGYVDKQSKKKKKLLWTIEDPNGEQTVEFGARTAIVLSGLNVDGGGSDVFALKKNGQASGFLNPFDGSKTQAVTFSFGSKVARKIRTKNAEPGIFSGRLGVIYRNKGNVTRYRTVIHNFSDGSKTKATLSTVPKGSLVEVVEILDGDGITNILLHEQVNKKQSRVRIFSLDGDLLFGDTYDGDTVLVGNYVVGAIGEQFGVASGTSLTVVSPFGGESSTLTLPSGIYADLANVNQFKKGGGSGGSSGGGSGGGSGGSGGTNPGLASVCPSISGFGGGRLWKPDSDVPDNRGGKPVMLLTGGNKTSRSSVRVYDSKGNTVCSGLTIKPNTNGINKNAQHFYAGWIGACSKTGGQMASAAKANTGSKDVWVQWKSNSCLKVGDPNQRHGGI